MIGGDAILDFPAKSVDELATTTRGSFEESSVAKYGEEATMLTERFQVACLRPNTAECKHD
jgi:hypothetical protein